MEVTEEPTNLSILRNLFTHAGSGLELGFVRLVPGFEGGFQMVYSRTERVLDDEKVLGSCDPGVRRFLEFPAHVSLKRIAYFVCPAD